MLKLGPFIAYWFFSPKSSLLLQGAFTHLFFGFSVYFIYVHIKLLLQFQLSFFSWRIMFRLDYLFLLQKFEGSLCHRLWSSYMSIMCNFSHKLLLWVFPSVLVWFVTYFQFLGNSFVSCSCVFSFHLSLLFSYLFMFYS